MQLLLKINRYLLNFTTPFKNIINFDGPGFMKKEYDSDKFKKMSSKLINIIPSNSYIGVLMYNSEYVSIKTSARAMNVHYPIYWNTYGYF